ncbi:hypothetical protein LC608_36575 [Nostoc sp. XA010]|uniref:hypothetical protein n=1 Tax=Nostoc sp. XA010 TaxID=2780407 RepID=UPI001E5025DF|nr:hypothetical protein [Nostoc sp. XA010]MCC5662320.1 hypothetical protein [Nostoc sp. XA010]
MTTYRQLTIWDLLDELSESPATSTLAPMWECLDAKLENLPLEAQLSTAGIAFNQIADILKFMINWVSSSLKEPNAICKNCMYSGFERLP